MAEAEKKEKPDPAPMATEETGAEEVLVNTQGLPIIVRELMGRLYWEAEDGPKGIIADLHQVADGVNRVCEFDPEGEVRRLDGIRLIGEFCEKVGVEYDQMMRRLHEISQRIEKPAEKAEADKPVDSQVQKAVAAAAKRIEEEKCKGKSNGLKSGNNRKPKAAARRTVSKAGNKPGSKRRVG